MDKGSAGICKANQVRGIVLSSWENVFSIPEWAIKYLLLSEYWVGEIASLWRRADTWARSTDIVSRSSSCLAINCFISSIWSCFAARACSANSTFAVSCSTTALSTLSSCKEELWLQDELQIWPSSKWKLLLSPPVLGKGSHLGHQRNLD